VDLFDWAGLAATTTGAALLYTLTGFGFAVLAAPLFLLFVDPPRAIQLVIIISTALSLVMLPGLWRAIAPALMLRLALGSLVESPLDLIASRYADAVQVRALVGATILGFAALLGLRQRRGAGEPRGLFGLRPGRDLAIGAVSGLATALAGMAGPPVLIYLLLAGVPPRTVRATLLIILRARLCGDAGFPRRHCRYPCANLAIGRDPDPVRLCRRPRRAAARRSPRLPDLCDPRHPSARGRRTLYPRRHDRGRCPLTITLRLGVTSRRGTVTASTEPCIF